MLLRGHHSNKYNNDGGLSVSGAGGLKSTQAYTKAYAKAVTQSWKDWAVDEPHPRDTDSDSDYEETNMDDWCDLDIQPVLGLLRK